MLFRSLYADVFSKSYSFHTIGLRYFNVFGPRQNPNGAYAAVVPKWTSALLKGDTVCINGDGESSRDFSFIQNAIQANFLAATVADTVKVTLIAGNVNQSTANHPALNQVYNMAVGDCTTLKKLFELIRENLEIYGVSTTIEPEYRDFRLGDVRHSLADISKAKQLLGYAPTHRIADGIRASTQWYVNQSMANKKLPL